MKITADEFREHCRRASEIVSKWPAWKRNILRTSLSPTMSEPREPVDNTNCDHPAGIPQRSLQNDDTSSRDSSRQLTDANTAHPGDGAIRALVGGSGFVQPERVT